MKYIRTNNGIYESDKVLFSIPPMHSKHIDIKTADTIDELIDICVVPEYIEPLYPLYIAKEHYQYCGKDVYGAIWIGGEHGEPILKSVAKMKGVLPNGEIDWELL